MDDDTDAPREVPASRMRTHCPDCGGQGSKWTPRMGTVGTEAAYMSQMMMCRTCRGAGKLEGFQPPV